MLYSWIYEVRNPFCILVELVYFYAAKHYDLRFVYTLNVS